MYYEGAACSSFIRRHDHLVVSYSVMLRLTSGFGRERPDPSLVKFPYDLSPNGFILHCILQYTTQDNTEILRRIFPHQLGLCGYPKKSLYWKSRKFAQFLIFLLSISNFQNNESVAQRVLTNQSVQPLQSGRCPLAPVASTHTEWAGQTENLDYCSLGSLQNHPNCNHLIIAASKG